MRPVSQCLDVFITNAAFSQPEDGRDAFLVFE